MLTTIPATIGTDGHIIPGPIPTGHGAIIPGTGDLRTPGAGDMIHIGHGPGARATIRAIGDLLTILDVLHVPQHGVLLRPAPVVLTSR